jgi:hypothetical protein
MRYSLARTSVRGSCRTHNWPGSSTSITNSLADPATRRTRHPVIRFLLVILDCFYSQSQIVVRSASERSGRTGQRLHSFIDLDFMAIKLFLTTETQRRPGQRG